MPTNSPGRPILASVKPSQTPEPERIRQEDQQQRRRRQHEQQPEDVAAVLQRARAAALGVRRGSVGAASVRRAHRRRRGRPCGSAPPRDGRAACSRLRPCSSARRASARARRLPSASSIPMAASATMFETMKSAMRPPTRSPACPHNRSAACSSCSRDTACASDPPSRSGSSRTPSADGDT